MRLQRILAALASVDDAARILLPFYVLYDFRVASSHLTSADTVAETLKKVTARLGLAEFATLLEIYETLTQKLLVSLQEMTSLVRS